MDYDWIKLGTRLAVSRHVGRITSALLDPEGEVARHALRYALRDMSVTRDVARCAVVGALAAVWGAVRCGCPRRRSKRSTGIFCAYSLLFRNETLAGEQT